MTDWIAPFCTSPARNGGLIHRAVRIAPAFDGGRVVLHLACGSHMDRDAVPVEQPEPGDDLCPRCDVEGIQAAQSVVYAAMVPGPRRGHPGPFIKVGHTGRLAARMIDLRSHLIAQAPGGPRQERRLMVVVRAAAPPVMGREWFPGTPEVHGALAQWFASAPEAVA